MRITKVSQATGITHTRDIPVDEDFYLDWTQGYCPGHIQDIFPDLDSEDREFLISGTTPEEWDDLFGGWEEDEEADYTDYPETDEWNDAWGDRPEEF